MVEVIYEVVHIYGEKKREIGEMEKREKDKNKEMGKEKRGCY